MLHEIYIILGALCKTKFISLLFTRYNKTNIQVRILSLRARSRKQEVILVE